MAAKKTRKTATKTLAPRGDHVGLARIRMWTNALEIAMIERYIGNAPTLKDLSAITKAALKDIARIKPALLSDCPQDLMHDPNCCCSDSAI